MDDPKFYRKYRKYKRKYKMYAGDDIDDSLINIRILYYHDFDKKPCFIFEDSFFKKDTVETLKKALVKKLNKEKGKPIDESCSKKSDNNAVGEYENPKRDIDYDGGEHNIGKYKVYGEYLKDAGIENYYGVEYIIDDYCRVWTSNGKECKYGDGLKKISVKQVDPKNLKIQGVKDINDIELFTGSLPIMNIYKTFDSQVSNSTLLSDLKLTSDDVLLGFSNQRNMMGVRKLDLKMGKDKIKKNIKKVIKNAR